MTPAPRIWSFRGTPARDELMFSAVPLDDGSLALAWENGTTGRLTRAQWEKFRPIQAQLAVQYGADHRAAFRFVPTEGLAELLAESFERALAVLAETPSLVGWYRLGRFGGQAS